MRYGYNIYYIQIWNLNAIFDNYISAKLQTTTWY
jgi:hypothetical protein